MFNKALIIGILLFGATFNVSANEVQKWEYKCIYTDREATAYKYAYISKKTAAEVLEEELNELGSKGWELQGYAMNDGANVRVLCLKRKKS